MDEKLDAAIEKMADLAKACQDSLKALQFSQAAMNLANTKAIVTGVETKPAKKQGAGAS